jgi:hypothetical protein
VTSQARTIVGGAVYGTCAAALVGFGVVRLFIQTSGSSLDALVWGAGFSMPWGPLAGAAGGWFLYWRARHVESIGRLVCEMSLLGAAVTTGIGQMLLPIAWQLPRFAIAVFTVSAGLGFAGAGTMALRPLYRPKTRIPN